MPVPSSHEVRRGHVDEAGPLAEEGIDPGRSIVPVGAEAECDVTLRAFDGGSPPRAPSGRPGSVSAAAVRPR